MQCVWCQTAPMCLGHSCFDTAHCCIRTQTGLAMATLCARMVGPTRMPGGWEVSMSEGTHVRYILMRTSHWGDQRPDIIRHECAFVVGTERHTCTCNEMRSSSRFAPWRMCPKKSMSANHQKSHKATNEAFRQQLTTNRADISWRSLAWVQARASSHGQNAPLERCDRVEGATAPRMHCLLVVQHQRRTR